MSSDTVNAVCSALSGQLQGELLDATTPQLVYNAITPPLVRDADKIAFTLDGVLRPVECMRLIEAAEKVGFGIAGLGPVGSQVVATGLRDSSRLISDDQFLADQIYHRIKPYLPTVWKGRRLLGLNEQLKFLRYHPGQRFVAHFDGTFRRPGTSNQTFFTVQLYLSTTGIKGGATRFVGGTIRDSKALAVEGVRCLPLPGRCLVFQHNILHEGEEVMDGIKYTVRTDVEYGCWSLLAHLQEQLGLGVPSLQRKKSAWILMALTMALTALALGTW